MTPKPRTEATINKRRGYGEGSIHKRADGRWVGTVELGWRTGRRQRKSVYAKTRREVTAKLREAQQRVEQGLAVLDDRRLLSDFLDTWLEQVVRPSVRPRTYES